MSVVRHGAPASRAQATLQERIEAQVIARFAPESAGTFYNAFYTAYTWSNLLMSLLAGWLVDRIGVRRCAIIFPACCLFGQGMCAPSHPPSWARACTPHPTRPTSTHVRCSRCHGCAAIRYALGPTMYWLQPRNQYIIMFGGRFVFGLGGGAVTIVQNVILAKWFRADELATAFGCVLATSRLASVANYDVTNIIYAFVCPLPPRRALALRLGLRDPSSSTP